MGRPGATDIRAAAPAFVLSLALAATSPALAQKADDPCDNCGKVVKVTRTTSEATNWRPLGSVTSGTMGDGLSQPGRTTTSFSISPGDSRPTMVALGAAGGVAYVKSPQAYQRPRWEIVVRMDRGDTRTVVADYDPLIDEGDRVRVYGTQVERLAQP